MITLAAFYKDLKLHVESTAVNDAVKGFDYKRSLMCLKETFEKRNPQGKFLVTTDLETELPFDAANIFRSELKDKGLMESLVLSNTEIIRSTVGKIILCGSDHLINGDLNNFFTKDFDIGILFNGTSVNNTVVLANIQKSTRSKIIDFFEEREKEYYQLSEGKKDWFGDQISYDIVLRKHRVLNDQGVIQGIHKGINLTFKFMKYGEDGVYGCKKSAASYNKQSLLIDFKGTRKRWFDIIYNELK